MVNDNLVKKFETLAKNFEVTTQGMEDEIKSKILEVELLDEKFDIAENLTENLNNLSSDFSLMRNTLLDNISNTKRILKIISDSIELDGSDVNPKTITGYSEILKNCNESIQLLGSIYKEISETHIKIKKVIDVESKDNSKNDLPQITIINTNDLLKELSN